MHRLVKVADIIEGAFAPMPAILAPLSPGAHALTWSILDLGEVIYEERWDLNMPFIEQGVAASPAGLAVSFDDLEAFAGRTRQVIDGLFVGCARPNLTPRRSDSDANILAAADMLVSAMDSSLWLVAAPEEALQRVEAAFERVETVELGSFGLSTWPRAA